MGPEQGQDANRDPTQPAGGVRAEICERRHKERAGDKDNYRYIRFAFNIYQLMKAI